MWTHSCESHAQMEVWGRGRGRQCNSPWQKPPLTHSLTATLLLVLLEKGSIELQGEQRCAVTVTWALNGSQVRNGSVGWDSATDWENKWPRESIRELLNPTCCDEWGMNILCLF